MQCHRHSIRAPFPRLAIRAGLGATVPAWDPLGRPPTDCSLLAFIGAPSAATVLPHSARRSNWPPFAFPCDWPWTAPGLHIWQVCRLSPSSIDDGHGALLRRYCPEWGSVTNRLLGDTRLVPFQSNGSVASNVRPRNSLICRICNEKSPSTTLETGQPSAGSRTIPPPMNWYAAPFGRRTSSPASMQDHAVTSYQRTFAGPPWATTIDRHPLIAHLDVVTPPIRSGCANRSVRQTRPTVGEWRVSGPIGALELPAIRSSRV